MRRRSAFPVALFALFVTLPATASPGRAGRIAFASERDGRIHVVAPDGSGARALAAGLDPSLAPDGLRIAFVRTGHVWVMRADGTGARRLTQGRSPAWSPDGRRIAFVRRRHVYLLALGGGGARRLTGAGGEDRSPSWSPDGRSIVFGRFSEALEHTRGDNYELFVVRADGSSQRRLTENFVDDEQPAWSPDGRRIAFARAGRVWLMRADGTDARPLARGVSPAWAPDGRGIVFSAAGGLRIVNTDGTGPHSVPGTAGGVDPSWSR